MIGIIEQIHKFISVLYGAETWGLNACEKNKILLEMKCLRNKCSVIVRDKIGAKAHTFVVVYLVTWMGMASGILLLSRDGAHLLGRCARVYCWIKSF